MVGKRVLQRAEARLLHIPLFRTVYAPVKQLVAAFSPDNEYGFKRVVLVQEPGRGYVLGFLTREFTLQRDDGTDTLVAVYVPTNHLYLGDIVVYPRERVLFPGADGGGRRADLPDGRDGPAVHLDARPARAGRRADGARAAPRSHGAGLPASRLDSRARRGGPRRTASGSGSRPGWFAYNSRVWARPIRHA